MNQIKGFEGKRGGELGVIRGRLGSCVHLGNTAEESILPGASVLSHLRDE